MDKYRTYLVEELFVLLNSSYCCHGDENAKVQQPSRAGLLFWMIGSESTRGCRSAGKNCTGIFHRSGGLKEPPDR